jgi:hypothetical protein
MLPDGRLIGTATLPDGSGHLSTVTAIATAEGAIERRLPQVPVVPGPVVASSLGPRVTPDGRAVAFVDIRDGHANIWTMPIAGGSTRQLTNFQDEEIFSFAFSPAGELAVAKGRLESDIITLTLSEGDAPASR